MDFHSNIFLILSFCLLVAFIIESQMQE